MCPPTQSMATTPTVEITASSLGIALTSPSPSRWDERRLTFGEEETDVVHLHDQGHDAVHEDRDRDRHHDQDDRPGQERLVGHLVERDHGMISAERMKSVRIAPAVMVFSASSPSSTASSRASLPRDSVPRPSRRPRSRGRCRRPWIRAAPGQDW